MAPICGPRPTPTFQPEAIFEVQDELVPRIVATVADVNGVLPRSMGDALRNRDSKTLTAYEAVLRGWSYYTRIAPDEHRDLRDVLERTVERSRAPPTPGRCSRCS